MAKEKTNNFMKRKIQPKIFINIGAGMDIPTGNLVVGKKGETIVNGGLAAVTGIVAPGNMFKSTILHYMTLSAADKISHAEEALISTYDTECNISPDRLTNLAKKFDSFDDGVIMSEDAVWNIADKSLVSADDWAQELAEYSKEKSKDKMYTFEAFKDPYTGGELKAHLPTFVQIDSLSEFEPESTMNAAYSNLDDSSNNTMYMKQGLFKTKFLGSLPTVANKSDIRILTSAHIGDKINMASGPAMYQKPTKKLQHLKEGDTIKGVSTKFFFLMNNCWYINSVSVLKNQTTKQAEYPINSDQSVETELNLVRMQQLRGKNGMSGYTLNVVVSQTEGVLPSLTEFHNIKTNGRYGLEGSDKNYNLILLPEVKLSRPTVRSKIDSNEKLRRAINITMELMQLGIFMPSIKSQGLYCTVENLYKDLKTLGYDWDELLDTRGWWAINQYDKKLKPFLSSMDLLRMRQGEYIPYWLDKDKKEKIKENIKRLKDEKSES